MRLAFVNQFYAPDISPTAQLLASLAEHRADLGDEVTVVAGRAGYLEGLSRSEPAERPGLRVLRVWTPDLGKSSTWRRLLGYASFLVGGAWRFATLRRQDVIVAMTTPPFVVLLALLHRLLHRRTRVVLWSMDCYPDAAERFGELSPGGAASRALRAVNRFAFRRLAHVVSLDGAMRELLQDQYAPSAEVPTPTVIPNWERLSLFPPPADVAPWSGFEDVPVEGRAVVVYLGNTGVGHRFDTVLDAAARLRDEALFLFIGGGSRWDDLATAVTERGIANVVMRGYIAKEETPAVLAGAHAALITLDERSLGVMSPSKLHGSLAAGLPVLYVGPEGSNVHEAIDRFGCGVSLREGDVEGLVAAVRRLRSDPDGPMAARARRAFEDAYCDAATLPRWDAVLAAVGPAPAAPAHPTPPRTRRQK